MSGLLFLFLTKRKSGWGICGSSWCLVWFLVCCDLPALLDLLGPCTNVVLTAYAHVRTEPQCDIGHTRGKKNRCHELGPGFHCGMHATKAASGIHPQHIHTGIPDQWNR